MLILEVLLVFLVIIFILALAGLTLPRIIHHKMPAVFVDISPFVSGECGGEEPWRGCPPSADVQNLGCEDVIDQPLFGGLTPHDSIVTCKLSRTGPPPYAHPLPGGCIYSRQGFEFYCYWHITYEDGKYESIHSMDAFRTHFAPVESAEEALGFALASGDFFAQYGLKKDANLSYTVRKLEDTYVKSLSDGYLVQVFHRKIFGCGPFYTEAVELQVSYNEHVTELRRFPVYHDPAYDGGCAD